MGSFTALYDASVLYPAPIRDLLMHLALTDLFRARWSRDIHDEWIRSVLKNRPDLTCDRLERTRDLMDQNVRDCVVSGYEGLIDGITLPDPGDRHVLAAAIRGRADVIVTFNVGDFPAGRLDPLGIEAQHPDEFITHLIDLSAPAVCLAAWRHRLSLKRPPKSVEQYLATLQLQGLPQTVSRLREIRDLI